MVKKSEEKKLIKGLKNENEILRNKLLFMETVNPLSLENLDAFSIAKKKSVKEECTVITQIGDVHIDEEVNNSIVSGLNKYNHEIGAQRIERYFSRLLYMTRMFRRTGMKIDNIVIHLAGDFISGWIHDELVQANPLTPIEGVLIVEQLLIKGIKTIAENGEFEKIVLPCSIGNHSRTTAKNHFKNTAITSYEWIIYHHMKEYFQNNGYTNVEFIISESPYTYYQIYNKINIFCHGNSFNYQGGIGGIEIPLKKWIHRENTVLPFDMAWMGHWHTYLVGSKVRINGSVIGYNEMGRKYGFTPEPPQMQFQLLDAKRGFTFNCPILLNDF